MFPNSPHGHCLRHLEESFHKQFKNIELKSLLWKAARATTKEAYDEAFANISKINEFAVPWLLKHAKPEHWATLYFEGNRYGHLTSSIAESLNSWILKAREMPILAMFETIRQQLMDWFAARRQLESNTTGIVVSSIGKQIQALINNRARRYRFFQSTDVLYEVISNEILGESIVNLARRTCSCREWQATGYPCGHALAIILSRHENPQSYVKEFFTLEAYQNTYAAAIIHPRNNDNFDQPLQFDEDSERHESGNAEDALKPPDVRRQPGRPKKKDEERRKDVPVERIRTQKCTTCRKQGHSKRTCKEFIT